MGPKQVLRLLCFTVPHIFRSESPDSGKSRWIPGYSGWIPVDSKHNISFLEHLNWFGVYLVHLVKCGYALEVI
jgi:hypothetical protein